MSENSDEFYAKLPKLIQRVIRPMGRFQYLVIFMLCYNNVIVGLNNTLSSFHTYQPDFQCGNFDTNRCFANGTCPKEYTFSGADKTIVTEWNLVCSRSLLAPMVNTLYFAGLTVGALLTGLAADHFGRKWLLLICIYVQGILGLCLSLVPNLATFIAIRTIQGVFVQGLQTIAYTLMVEYCAPSKRTLAGLLYFAMWSIGLLYLGTLSYAAPEWRNLQLLLAISTILTFLWTWLIPESIHWHIVNHRPEKAFELCVKTATYNNNYDVIASDHKYWKENVRNQTPKHNTNEDVKSTSTPLWSILFGLFRTKCLKKHILLMTFTWFSTPITYWGILYFMPTLTGNRHMNFIISAAIEFCVYFVMCLFLTKFGRRRTLMVYSFVNGALLICIGMLTAFDTDLPVMTIVTLIARGTSASIYYGISVYASELFPTVNLSCAFGLCSFAGRLGSIVAPFMLPLTQKVSPILPMSLLGCSSIVVGIAQYFLPETVNIQLPNSIEDAKAMWGQ